MFKKLFPIMMVLVIAGCASAPSKNSVSDQVLKTNFKEESVEVETSCLWLHKDQCRITKVTSIGTAPSNGGTVVNRNIALTRACDNSRANVAQFFNSTVTMNRLQKTVSDSVEKTGSTLTEETDSMNKQNNTRANTNDTKYSTVQTIQIQAAKTLEGYRVIKQEVVGDQEVACTIQYDEESARIFGTLRK